MNLVRTMLKAIASLIGLATSKKLREDYKKLNADFKKLKRITRRLAETSDAMNAMIRRNAIEGNLGPQVSMSVYEEKCLHILRKTLSRYYGLPIDRYENNKWLLTHVIRGDYDDITSYGDEDNED